MNIQQVLYSFVISLITTLTVVLTLEYFSAKEQQFAHVNLDQIVKGYVVKLSKSDMSDEEKKFRTKLFSQELEKSLKEISQKYNLTIFTHKAIIEGALDITPLVQKHLGESR